MTMNTVLDAAERRIGPAAALAQAQRQDIIEAMRDEIGFQHYDQAMVELPKLEQLLAKEIRPYLNRLTKISQRASTPLRPDILAYVRELETASVTVTDWVRVGIAEWNGLVPPFVPGTRQLDMTRRSEEVGSIRMKLTNWNGRESRMRDLMAFINNFIEQSGWPASGRAEL